MRKFISVAVLLIALLSTAQAWGADTKTPARYYDVNKMLLYEKSKQSDEAVQTELNKNNKLVYPFAHFRALTGRNCVVNDIFTTLGVASWPQNLGNMTNNKLDDYTGFTNGVGLSAGYDPLVSVRDMTRHYAKGTMAGFCIGQEGTGLLKVELIQKFVIEFYREGEKVGEAYAKNGSNFKGVNLSLGSLPGSSNATYNIQAEAPEEFDEIRLVNTGVDVKVLARLDVHYAYVGEPTLYTLTNKDQKGMKENPYKDFDDYCTDYGVTKSEDVTGNKNLVNDDVSSDHAVGNLGIVIGSTIPLRVQTHVKDGETFRAGSVVGFNGKGGSLADINVLSGGILIRTWDKDNNPVESFTMDKTAVGLTLISGGESNLSFITTKPFSGVSLQYLSVLGVNVGETVYNYAFVEPAPDIDHHCDIDPTPDMNICADQTTAQLYSNSKVPVTWSVESKPDGSSADIDASGYVTGMNETTGTYKFKAKSEDGCYDIVTITKNQVGTSGSTTTRHQISTKDGIEKISSVGPTGSLISWSKFDDGGDKLLDGDPNTYAKYKAGLQLAGHVGVVALQTKDRANTFREALHVSATDSLKIGFLIQNKGKGLSLNLLNGYSMIFYKDGKEVQNSPLHQANVLSLGLAEKTKVQKMELAAIVPPNVDFDQMGLYHDGVLGVDISEQDFYYPFCETGKDLTLSDDPLGCTNTVVSVPIKTDPEAKTPASGASIDGNNTSLFNTVGLAGGIDDLSNIIDGSLSTGVTIGSVATVGGGTTIAVKLGRRADYRQQLAIVMDDNNYEGIFGPNKDNTKGFDPLGVGVGKWMKVQTYLDGVATGETKTDWSVLGTDVLTTKGHNVYIWNPKKEYDEVVITLAGIVKAADVQKIYGIVLQSDIDGDGVPDCKDDDSCNGEVKDINNPHTCLGSDITFTFTGKKGFNYKVEAADQSSNLLQVTEQGDGKYEGTSIYACTMHTTKAGIFSARILQEKASSVSGYAQDGVIDYVVHPTLTHWNPATTNTDWNAWSNWTEGSPYSCTDVVIPTGAKTYPVLKDAKGNDENQCKDIHFEPGAAVENVFRLNYQKAWVDLGLRNGVTSLWMAPLAQVYSGDLYASTVTADNYFTDLTDANDPASFSVRTNPLIYQRIWKASVAGNYTNATSKYGDVTLISKGTWSHAFNSLKQDYATVKSSAAPACFALMADDNSRDDNSYTIHLPKSGNRTYHYYNALQKDQGSETVPHDDTANKLWSTQNWTNDALVLNYTNGGTAESGSTTVDDEGVFLVGNPTMSHLDVTKFLSNTENAAVISGIKLYQNNTIFSVIKVGDTMITSSSTGLTDEQRYIAPAGAFFAVAQDVNNAKATTLQVNYDKTMFGGKDADKKTASTSKVRSNSTLGLLRVTATGGKNASGTVILEGSDAKAATLMDEDYKPSLALFSIDNGKAYDIRPEDGDIIELGVSMAKADSVKLDFHAEGNASADGWKLYDRLTGNSYEPGDAPVIYMDGSSVGRFYLSRIGTADNIKATNVTNSIYATAANGMAEVTSTAKDIRQVEVFSSNGSLIDEVNVHGDNHATVRVQPGFIIIKVTRLDGTATSFKLMAQ